MKQGGYLANSSGRVLENMVESTIKAKGLASTHFRLWQKEPDKYGDEVLIKNVPYTSIYQHASKTEFLIKSAQYQVLTRVECKWQQSSGSVDEKYPFLFLNCTQRMHEPHIIILLDGGGAKQGAIDWLRQACHKFNDYEGKMLGRKIELFNTTEFMQWANRTFR